ncbi:MAG: hypothetical protein ACI9QL_001133 [Candidatus Omnitrophota bacterium]|jgi:hypothetical protein
MGDSLVADAGDAEDFPADKMSQRITCGIGDHPDMSGIGALDFEAAGLELAIRHAFAAVVDPEKEDAVASMVLEADFGALWRRRTGGRDGAAQKREHHAFGGATPCASGDDEEREESFPMIGTHPQNLSYDRKNCNGFSDDRKAFADPFL